MTALKEEEVFSVGGSTEVDVRLIPWSVLADKGGGDSAETEVVVMMVDEGMPPLLLLMFGVIFAEVFNVLSTRPV